MAVIETIYRARVDYDADPDTVDDIENRAFKFARKVEVESMGGNACCSPYVVAESESRRAIEAWAGKVERYINRRKGAKVRA